MSIKKAVKMALMTMAVMYAGNYLATVNPTLRKIIKGSSLTVVGNNNTTAVV